MKRLTSVCVIFMTLILFTACAPWNEMGNGSRHKRQYGNRHNSGHNMPHRGHGPQVALSTVNYESAK